MSIDVSYQYKQFDDEAYFEDKDIIHTSNKAKGSTGELMFKASVCEYPVISNITYGHRQKDIDHIILTYDRLVFNESKNVNENFIVTYSWFLSHVLDRFIEGLPIAQYFAKTLGYNSKNISFNLTISKLNTSNFVKNILDSLGINVIEVGEQLIAERVYQRKSNILRRVWSRIKKQFLSVYTYGIAYHTFSIIYPTNTPMAYSNSLLAESNSQFNDIRIINNPTIPCFITVNNNTSFNRIVLHAMSEDDSIIILHPSSGMLLFLLSLTHQLIALYISLKLDNS